MEKNDFAFGKMNYLLIAVAVALLIIGFVLMSGGGSNDPNIFNPELFSAQRIKLAPLVVISGFALMVYAILHKEKEKNNE